MSAPQSYYVPVDAGEAEFTEKRSRFLGHVRRVETEAEARAFLDEMRKKYYDARHNCWCYVLHEGGVVRYGDDGEPQGTAGQPMLNVFQREGVENVVCVVTRYFGGVLLGIIEKVCQSIPVISPYTTAIEFSLLIVILLVKPIGLLGKKRREKV